MSRGSEITNYELPITNLSQAVVRAAVLDNANDLVATTDWENLPECELAALDLHGLVPLAAHLLHRAGCEVPAAWARRAQDLALRRMLLEDGLKEIGAAFHARGIPVATTRAFGPVAAMYPTPECRPTSDLDLVITPGDYRAAVLCVRELGFTPTRSGQANTFCQGLVNLDLMCNLTGLIAVTGLGIEADNFPGLDQAWSSALIPAGKVGISWFKPPTEFLLAALHYAYKHRFSAHVWGLDLLFMVGRLTPDQEQELLELAGRTRAAHLLAAAVRKAATLVGTEHAPITRLTSRLPARDPNPVRRFLQGRPAGLQRGKDAGMLLALSCAKGLAGVMRLAWHLLSRPPQERNFAGFAGRLLRLPLRVARVLFGG